MGSLTLLFPIVGWLLVIPLLGIWGRRDPHFVIERPERAGWAVVVFATASGMIHIAGWWFFSAPFGFVFRLFATAPMSVIAWITCQYFLRPKSTALRRRAEMAIIAVLAISALLVVVPQYGPRWEAAAGALLLAGIVYVVNGLMGHIADGLLSSVRIFLAPNQCEICGREFEVASGSRCPSCDAPLRGQCVRRGYDLTGNATGRCPECGTDATARLFRFDMTRFSHSHCRACGHNSPGRPSRCPECGFAPLALKGDAP